MPKRVIQGTVTSTKMAKTLVVNAPRRYKDSRIGKTLSSNTKYKVHFEGSGVGVGDFIECIESRPVSKDKKWRFVKVLKKAADTFEIKEDAQS